MVNTVEQSIAHALDDPDDRSMVARVKETVAGHLRRMDPHATVTPTEFFNHTHVPDLILQWPDQPRTPRRYIYLRTTSDPFELEDDLQRLPNQDSPVLLTLEQLPPERRRPPMELRLGNGPKLLIDAQALGTLQPRSAPERLRHLASRTVLEGGRGTFDGPATEQYLSTVTRGAEAARSGDPEPTLEAVEILAARTSPDVSDRMTAFLAALWQGGGAAAASFPGPQRSLGRLDETALAYLLEAGGIPDSQFWNRVVRMIELPILLRTAVSDSDNLQYLMRQAIRLWDSRNCMVVPGIDAPGASPWRWSIKSGQLILQTPQFRLLAANAQRQLPIPEEYGLPLLDEVRARAARFAIPLTELRMVVTNRHVGYGGPGDDISHDVQLDGISNALGEAEGVIEADVKVPSGATLQCVYGTRIASARGARTKVPLDALFGTAARMLLELSEAEMEKLSRVLGAQGQPTGEPWTQQAFDGM